MSYVLYFSKPFALAIAIWPFLSLLLTLPVLALLYPVSYTHLTLPTIA